MLRNILYPVLIVIVIGGVVGTLFYTGVLKFRAGEQPNAAAITIPPDDVAVPLSARDIPAYSSVSREHLLNPKTSDWAYIVMPKESAEKAHFLLKVEDILGRVLRADKSAGHAFTAADFYPEGTLPGEAAGVPPGKRALTLDVSKVIGVRDLLAGDHVDLVAAQAIEVPKTPPVTQSTLGMSGLTPQTPVAVPTKQATLQVLVQNGVVVTPLTVRQVPYMNSPGLTSAGQLRTKPLEEITIAVDPEEVPALTKALAVGADISCLVHSGQPGGDSNADRKIPSDKPICPRQQIRTTPIESIVGSKHQVEYVPASPAAQGNPETKP